MDVKLQWCASEHVEGLVGAIDECKRLLLALASEKRADVEHAECDAYACSKVVELLEMSERWAAVADPSADGSKPWLPELVAAFPQFKLHRHGVMGEGEVRVVVTTEVTQAWYGNVDIA